MTRQSRHRCGPHQSTDRAADAATGQPGRRRWNGSGESGASPSKLYRLPEEGYLAGVAAGIAAYFGLQGWVVRAAFVLGLVIAAPPTILVYLILALFLPKAPEHLYRDAEEERFWRTVRLDPSRSFSTLRHRFRELEQRLRAMEAYVTSNSYRVQREFNDLER